MNTGPKPPPVVDPTWWTLPEVRSILAGRDITGLFKWLQKRQGWSQQQIGSLTGQSQPEVSAILHGRRITAYDVMVRVADGLHVPRLLMGLGSCLACDAHAMPAAGRAGGDEAVERREFLTAVSVVAAGGGVTGLSRWSAAAPFGAAPVPARIGAGDVAQVRAMAAHLRSLDNRYGGIATFDAGRGFAGWAWALLRSDCHEATSRDLKSALSELCADVGWSANDAGRIAEARRYQARALLLARAAGEPGLVAEVLCQIDLAGLQYDIVAAPRISEHGLAMDPDRCYPGTLAVLHANVAKVAAVRGEARAAVGALGRADEALADAADAPVPVWAAERADTTRRHAAGRGWLRIYARLSRHPELVRYAQRVIELGTWSLADRSQGRREATHDRAELAAAHLRAGDRDTGLAHAHAVLDDLPGLRSARNHMLLADLSEAVTPHAGHPGADDLRARITAAN